MREIKFRKLLNGHWVYWTPTDGDNGFWEYARENENQHIVEYTGLKDKNGREIYEGDIVDIHGSEWNDISVDDKQRQKVVWNTPCFAFVDLDVQSENDPAYCFSTYCSGRDMEIIGNIYENGELLNKLERGG